jgi:hypothetical protein
MNHDEALAKIIDLAQHLAPSLLPDLDSRAHHPEQRPHAVRGVQQWRWATKEDQWPYGEAAEFIRGPPKETACFSWQRNWGQRLSR